MEEKKKRRFRQKKGQHYNSSQLLDVEDLIVDELEGTDKRDSFEMTERANFVVNKQP
jgi:hypothetical protein